MEGTAGAGGIPPTWTYFTAFPVHFLGVVAGILLGARDLLAVLDTVPARAQDAGQEAVEPEDGVPHFPVGVGLPVVNASWRRQREEPETPGSKSSSSWHAQGLLELATFHNLPNSSAHQQHTRGTVGAGMSQPPRPGGAPGAGDEAPGGGGGWGRAPQGR